MAVVIKQHMAAAESPQPEKINMTFVTLVSIVAALGGLLFGFDIAVVSGAIGFMEQKFMLSSMQVGWAVSSLIVGCIVGAGFSGVLSERFGRKNVLIAAALLFVIGSIGSAIPATFSSYIIARIIGGIGIGITSTLCPLYNAEIAPAKFRGRLVALNQFAIVTGIFVVYFLNMWIAGMGDDAWDVSTAWRWMFAVGAVPGLLFFILLFFIPESPRWLIKQGKAAQALPILLRIHGEEAAKKEVLEIKESFKQEQQSGSLKQLFKPGLRTALFVGVMLAILQHVTGINAIMYYAPEIFKTMGAGTDASLTQTILIGLINFLFTILAVWLIDKVGRKALLLVGSSLMTVCLAVIGGAFYTGLTTGPLVLIFILVYVAAFAISLGPVVWVMLSEIFPNRVRGIAIAIASVALWGGDYVVSQMFPPMLEFAGAAMTFWIFGAASLFTFFFTWRSVPETKGKTLEDMEAMWAAK
ncbi:MFS transporter [Paenibacillus darwinianus]|uniref:MFS transporter n=1 Tax=Paenibacillus darwinianus TaxID=1380763 RepID=A0A9W5S0H5_9BACL|nr:sugar porter family MFS transporter [Paenibacillus darwinianus]EXX87521.1 MFS transporter [Paenibacillus darwinianus]EXX88411.1 MFS transporter [Paenibacillus darwinianus]EXX88752.1 MFS transporter [Paenibacillus darwinianus]